MVARNTSQNGLEPRFSNQGFIPRESFQGFKAFISRELQALLKKYLPFLPCFHFDKIDRGWDTLRKKFSKPTRWIESGSIECRFRCNPKWDLLIHQHPSLNFYSTHLPIYPSILSIYPSTHLSIYSIHLSIYWSSLNLFIHNMNSWNSLIYEMWKNELLLANKVYLDLNSLCSDN